MTLPIITLTTDFGLRDGYVAAMKGVVLGICPGATIVDVSHEIPAQDIAHAAFVLEAALPYFPKGTIHVAVVDPGVGSARHPLLLETPQGFFIGPDNGIFTCVIRDRSIDSEFAARVDTAEPLSPVKIPVPDGVNAYVLNRADYWLEQMSNTFHGRDIFAPVAAHIALGVEPRLLGDPLEEVYVLNIPQPAIQENEISGQVIYIDRFGNLVTNISGGSVAEKEIEIEIAGRRIHSLSLSYYSAASELLATIGSHGYLEVAVRNGSAAEYLDVSVGTAIEVKFV